MSETLHPDVVKRQRMEKAIVRSVIRTALKAGYKLNLSNGGDTYELPEPTDKYKVINEAMFATDEEHLYIFTPEGKRIGWVWFVYGNDGWDVICDYTTNLNDLKLLVEADALSEKYQDRN